MLTSGRAMRLLPLIGTLAFATAGLSSSANGQDTRPAPEKIGPVMGLADIDAPRPITESAEIEEPALAMAESPSEDLGSGMASYYGNELAGRRTASGERFNPRELTAAHRTLPFGSKVRVTNPRSGKSVVVRINDRGPFARGRTIDVSEAAARQIGLHAAGHGQVKLALLDR